MVALLVMAGYSTDQLERDKQQLGRQLTAAKASIKEEQARGDSL